MKIMQQGNEQYNSCDNITDLVPESMFKKENEDSEGYEISSQNSLDSSSSHSSIEKPLQLQCLTEVEAERIKQEVRELQKQRFSNSNTVGYDSDSDDDSVVEIDVSDGINSIKLLQEHNKESINNQVQNEFTVKQEVTESLFSHTAAETYKAQLSRDGINSIKLLQEHNKESINNQVQNEFTVKQEVTESLFSRTAAETYKAQLSRDNVITMSPKNKDMQDSNFTIEQREKSFGLNSQNNQPPLISKSCTPVPSIIDKTNLHFLDRPIQSNNQSQLVKDVHQKTQNDDWKTNSSKQKIHHNLSKPASEIVVKTENICEMKSVQKETSIDNSDTIPKTKNSVNKTNNTQSINSGNKISDKNLSTLASKKKRQSGALNDKIEFLKKRQIQKHITENEGNIPLDLCVSGSSRSVSEKRFDASGVKMNDHETLHKNKHILYSDTSEGRIANATDPEIDSSPTKETSSGKKVFKPSLHEVCREFSLLSDQITISIIDKSEHSVPFQDTPPLDLDKSSLCDDDTSNHSKESTMLCPNIPTPSDVTCEILKNITITSSNVRPSASKIKNITGIEFVDKATTDQTISSQLEIDQSNSSPVLNKSKSVVQPEALHKYMSVLYSPISKSKKSSARKKPTLVEESCKNECLKGESSEAPDSNNSVELQQSDKVHFSACLSPNTLAMFNENDISSEAYGSSLIPSNPAAESKIYLPDSSVNNIVTSNSNRLTTPPAQSVSVNWLESTPMRKSDALSLCRPNEKKLSNSASPSRKHSVIGSECNTNKLSDHSSQICTSGSLSVPRQSVKSPVPTYSTQLKEDVLKLPRKETVSAIIEKCTNDAEDTSDITVVFEQKNKVHHVDLCLPDDNMNIQPLKHTEAKLTPIDFKTQQRSNSSVKTNGADSICTDKSPIKLPVDLSEPSTSSKYPQYGASSPSTSLENSTLKDSTQSQNLKLSYQISQQPNKFSVQKNSNSFEILMSRQKTPKKSPPKRLGKNSPVKFVKKSRTSPQILKYSPSPNKNSPCKQLNFNVSNNKSPMAQSLEQESRTTDYLIYAEEFVTYFETMLDDLLEDNELSAIIEKEAKVFTTFKNLVDVQAKKLYIRMLGRKYTWHRVSDIKYKDIDVKVAFNYSSEELEILLNLLKLQELKTLCKYFRITPVTLPKPALINSLLEYGKSQNTVFGCKGNNASSVLRDRLRDNLNHCIKLNEQARQSFFRLFQLFSLPHQDLDSDREVSKQLLLMHYVKTKRVEYPRYDILKTIPIFSSRDEFICDKAAALPLFLRRYNGGSTYAYVMTSAIEACRKKKEFLPDLVDMLKILLGQKIYLPHYRGRWYEQLILIQELHFKDFVQVAETIIEAMNDNHLNEVQQHVISARGSCLLSRKKGIDGNELKTRLVMSIKTPLLEPRCYLIKAKALSNAPGYKKVYIQQDNHAGETTFSSVEEYAISDYRTRGYTEGIHGESSIIITLFGFIFWDLIYEYPVPDVFRSNYQREPLDLHTGEFYTNRKDMIDDRLKYLCDWDIGHVKNHIESILLSHGGKESVINWKRFRSLNQIVTLIECINVQVLSKILERLIKNYQSVRRGFPDLLVWNPNRKECKFVEVKGPNDRLSVAQKMWLNYLTSCNAECAEVCQVETTGSKTLKRKRNANPTIDDDFE
ncbi:hypothetical protein C0J52_16421 [Blattella germanica]|nr:hypothetical protein C0J52_16421 [Blattella germanica]